MSEAVEVCVERVVINGVTRWKLSDAQGRSLTVTTDHAMVAVEQWATTYNIEHGAVLYVRGPRR